MGDATGTGQSDERPVREVNLRGFWMMRTEVTRAMFSRFAKGSNHTVADGCWVFEDGWTYKAGLTWRNPGFTQTPEDPVTCVSWHDAQAFVQWLNRNTGERFRLPSEAEWEYATRAGSNTIYFTGNDAAGLCHTANAADFSALEVYPSFSVNDCDDGFAQTAPVRQFAENPWGLFDVYGNVWEWVEDCWTPDYRDAPVDGSAYRVQDCVRRGFRGGGYGDIPRFARSTIRNRGDAGDRKDDIGFRLARNEPL